MSCLDGSLLDKARKGDRESIMALCEYLASCQKDGNVPDAEAASFLCEVLEKIGNGEAPDAAFGWKQTSKGRRRQNSAYQQWDIKMSVQELMSHGISWRRACEEVSSDKNGEFLRSKKTIENVCAGLTVDTELSLPDDLYPMGKKYNNHRRNA